MSLSELSLKRPVLATVLNLVIVLLGLVAWDKLTVREYPNIEEPTINVSVVYEGASAEVMEREVTQPLEDALAGIEGIKVLTSSSRERASNLNIRFQADRDPSDAAAEVRDRVSRVRGRLPEDIDEPVIAKVEADADPIVWMNLRSKQRNASELTDIADRQLQDALQAIPGVADVSIFGARRYAMRIWLDAAKLDALGLTALDVENALRDQNLELPSGRIESLRREFTVLTRSRLENAAQFNQLVLKASGERIVRLSDVGRAVLGVEDDRVILRSQGQNGVGLGLIRQATANPLDISKAVKALLPRLKQQLPPDVELVITLDTAVFIDQSLQNVVKTLIEALALVLMVVLLFLRSFRASLVPMVTIPISLIGVLAVMVAFGFSINTLTLLALVLAIGLVVDDAIVVLENIHRKMDEGLPPQTAALLGMREITVAIIAMTVTLAAVYLPVAFLEGRTGRLFREFALTLAVAVIISGFVALTLAPVLTAMLSHAHSNSNHKPNRLAAWLERGFVSMEQGYQRALNAILAANWAVAAPVLIFAVLGTAALYRQLPNELAPYEDRGVIFHLFTAPEGATVDYVAAYGRKLEAILETVPEKQRYVVTSGVGGNRQGSASQGRGFMSLKPWDERERTSKQIAQDLGKQYSDLAGVNAFPVLPGSLGAGGTSRPVEFIVKDSVPYPQILAQVEKLLQEAKKNPNLLQLDIDLKLNTPRLEIDLNRNQMAVLGVSVASVARTLQTSLAGREVTRFERSGEQYEVLVQLENDQRRQPSDILALSVRSNSGALLPLSAFANVRETTAPRDLPRFNRMRAVTLTANLAPGYSLGEALADLQARSKGVLSPTAQIDYGGQSREYREASGGVVLLFGLALVFIYLVLAAQFESWRDPFIILFTVPLAALGALAALNATGNTLNIYSQIGLVTLVGLITKHGILIVEFANQRREYGLNVHQAVLEAATARLRPILMTTGAMVFGSLPLALGSGAGSEARAQMGWVIVGGLTVGTLLTLFILPTVYGWISKSDIKK